MVVPNPYLSIITLNVNGLNSTIKGHAVAGWIRKQDPTIGCFQETHLSSKDKHRLEVKKWNMMIQANGCQKKVGVAILVSDKIGFRSKKLTRDNNGHYIMM